MCSSLLCSGWRTRGPGSEGRTLSPALLCPTQQVMIFMKLLLSALHRPGRPRRQRYSKCGPQPSSITRELVRDANSQPHPRPTESETLGMGPSNLRFNKHYRSLWCTLKFENHSSPNFTVRKNHLGSLLNSTFEFSRSEGGPVSL